jgi:hypothetical protein
MTLTPLLARSRRVRRFARGSAGGAFAGSSYGWIHVPLTTGAGGGAMTELTWVGCVVAMGVGEEDGEEETLMGLPACPDSVRTEVLREVTTRSTGLLPFCPSHGEPLEAAMSCVVGGFGAEELFG